ncbi:hypothetical protein JG688_00000959 [Phytophthora aleatoria]|uniref:SAM domain-containing protein n=1 Tax=Phytophthora aleatoria TaxID=2496075 RepID=A0A8J5IWF7_9STRA|nr:hypothetical protein JG688_00000959 [Phytophthora aleatoria]
MEGVAPWSSWSCADVGHWLCAQGFQEHVELFAANKISGAILPELTRNALRDDLGIAAFGDRVRISQAIEALIASASGGDASTSLAASTSITTASTTATPQQLNQAWLPRDDNALDLVVLHAAPLVIKDSRHRIYPMEKLDLEAERREISNSLLTDVQHKAIHVRFDIATADILRSLMTAWKCTVLHFSGHGLGQRAALCFEDGAGCTHLITPDALRQLMFSGDRRQQQVPGAAPVEMKTIDAAIAGPKPLDGNVELVFVNACHSQKVASVFLNAGIPHVVAVHSDSLVVDASATMFAKHFYLSLFHGHTVSTAFEIAKGIGKSSLIISVAHFVHSRRMFPDGVFYVDLEGQKLSTVRYAIAQSIGMPAADTDEEVFAELGTKNCLLVLDKVEELLDEDENKGEELLHQLISVAPNLKLLLASRRNMHIPSVTPYSLSISELPLHTALFAEEEAGRMGEECLPDQASTTSPSSSFVAASMGAPPTSIPLGKELLLTWKRRFVRYYCMIVAKASHAYRFDGTLALFDKERANIESAMRLAHELTQQSIEQLSRETRSLNCTCGNRENDPATLLWDVEEAKFDRELSLLDKLPSFEEPQLPAAAAAAHDRCVCVGIRELIALEALLLTDLGYACCDVTDWVAAEYHYLESLRLQREVLGCHAKTAVAKSAASANGEGEPQPDIASMYRQSLKIREITLGENHPQVAQSLNNLALYLSNQLETQQLSEDELSTQRAEIGRLYERALRIRRSRLGNASFETAATLNNMGNFKRLAKDWRGAEENIKEALQITDRYFNDISPRAARIFINLARVYRDQKRYEEAIAAYKKAQDIRQQLFPDTRDVGFCIEQIGKCLRLQGKEEEGKGVEERGRQMKKLGLSALEQDEMGQDESSSSLSGETNSFKHAVLSGDSVEGSVSSGHLFARVNVYDSVDAEALVSRKFNFPGKLLGERGIHLKKIEAIACAQLRYFGPWPQSLSKWGKGRGDGKKEISTQSMPEAYIQITSTSETVRSLIASSKFHVKVLITLFV